MTRSLSECDEGCGGKRSATAVKAARSPEADMSCVERRLCVLNPIQWRCRSDAPGNSIICTTLLVHRVSQILLTEALSPEVIEVQLEPVIGPSPNSNQACRCRGLPLLVESSPPVVDISLDDGRCRGRTDQLVT